MQFESPSNSLSFRTLLEAAEHAGFDRANISRLLWLLNAHPRLVAHARVFEHVAALLDAPAFRHIGPELGQWVEDVPLWRQFGLWISQNEALLAGQPGLERLFESPRSERDHPILGEGVGRHALVAAMWSRHQTDSDFPPEASDSSVAWRYYCLQAQVLLSQLESRWKHSKQVEFENYNGESEFGRVPCATAGVCLAIREFSLAKYGTLLLRLHANSCIDDFVDSLSSLEFKSEMTGEADVDDAERYFLSLKRYVRRYWRVRHGIWSERNQRQRQVIKGAGGHVRRPGFVDVPGVPGIYLLESQPRPDDFDIPWQPGAQVFISDPDDIDAPDCESAPDEGLEHVFDLVFPEEVGGARAKAKYQNLAVEMAAQHFSWDFSGLTEDEISVLSGVLQDRIESFYGTPRNRSIARYEAIASLIIKTCLYLGQPLEVAADLRFTIGNGVIDLKKVTLRLESDGDVHKPIEWLLPSITPDYRTEFEDAWEEHNRPRAKVLRLPDLTELGAEVTQFLSIKQRSNDKVFEIELPEAKKQVRVLLSKMNDPRITIEKISRVLDCELMRHRRDQCFAWVATANHERRRETRLHYARYGVFGIENEYRRAIGQIAKSTHAPDIAPPRLRGDESIGARYVLKAETVKELIAELIGGARAKLIPGNQECVTNIHNAFTLYVWVWQSLTTSMRAISQPIRLIKAWRENPQMTLHGLADKEGRYQDKARLLELSDNLSKQFKMYERHCRAVERTLRLKHVLINESEGRRFLFFLSPSGQPQPVKPGAVESAFDDLGFPILANFSRSFLRTELIDGGCEAEVVDAFLGHANRGESPFSLYSSFDYSIFRHQIAERLPKILKSVGLKVIHSRLVRV